MLPDLRFVFGSLMVIAVSGMIGVGLFVSARLFDQVKMGPVESRRNLAFTDSAEWNQFHDPGSVRRYVGLARQGETREIADLPPEHRPLETVAPALAVDLTPVEVSEQDDGVEAVPSPVEPAAADSATGDVAPPLERTSAVVGPSLPDQAREALAPERAAAPNANTVTDVKPGPADTVVAYAVPMRVRGASSAAEDHPPSGTPDPNSTERSVDESAPPQPPKAPLTAAPHSPAAPVKAVVPPPSARAPVKRAARAIDDDDERPRTANPPRPRMLASRPRTASQAYGPHWNGTQSAPRQNPPGQPVFGPHFPYATPQPGQPHFGPHFPYATPQPSRQAAARAPQPRSYAQPSYDPRHYAPQPSFRQPRQRSYVPAYGWR